MSEPAAGWQPRTVADLTRGFAAGVRPSDVAGNVLAAIRASDRDDPPLRAVITPCDALAASQAAAADQRWLLGKPRSPLDGVPIVVKDNLDVAGVPTTNGTAIEFPLPSKSAWVVDRLAELGAILVGKANLHEIGAGTTGINPRHGTPRNPYDPARWCGGSSSGSACAVGAGLVPLAIGTDGGGSIRSPAAFVGAVGLKPTFGRTSRIGLSMVADTLDHLGPITMTCADAALALVATSAIHPDDDETWDQPPLPSFDRLRHDLGAGIGGLRIGFARHTLDHPRVEPAVAAQVSRAADALAAAGARVLDVELPDLDHCLTVGLILIGAEGPSGHEELFARHRRELGVDIQVLLSIGAHVTASDYLKAQRARNQIRRAYQEIFAGVDLILLPGAGLPAGVIQRDALVTGELDEETSSKAIACTFPSNLTGYPALTVPCGRVGGLPVSAQLIAGPWQELTALRAGMALERAGLYPPVRPGRYFADRWF